MRVLVTGGAGYLGSQLTALLLEKGHTVRLFDRFCFGDDPLQSFPKTDKLEVVRGDIRRLQETPDLLVDVDAVVHLASLSNDPSSDLDPEMAIDINLESTKELISLSIHHGVRRFVFASSCSVYGKGVFELLDEQSPTNPITTFGRTKRDAEVAVLAAKSDSFEPVVARAATLFGWSPRMRFDLAVNQMVASAARHGKISVHGGGGQWRPFIHIRDAARALLTFIEAPARDVSGELFNVGSDICNFRIVDLAQRVAKFFPGVHIDVAKEDEDLRSCRVHFGKIRDKLKFKCEWTLEDGVRELIDGLQDSALDPFADIHFNVRRMKELRATPVDEGGEPIAPRFIPLARPSLGPEEEQAIIATLRSGWLTTGAKVQAFEKAVAESVQAPDAIAVSSCTAALHLCLVHAGVKAGDEVITTPLNWASSGNTVLNLGAKPVFADICPDTLNIDPEAIERAITPRTKAIMPVHHAGQPCDLDAVYAVARRHNIPVVEDAAHALGAAYKGSPVGKTGVYACFSFYPIKNITTIDGGAIATTDPETAAALRVLANNGMSAIAWHRYGRSATPAQPEVVTPGYKYRMHDVSAAMGIEQMKKLPAFMAARRRLARMYSSVLSDVEEISLPAVSEDSEHAWHLYIIRLKLDRLTMNRDEIAQALRRENVGTGIHFVGLHLHQYYRETLGYTPEDLPVATAASREILSLPLFPLMTDKNVSEVVEALKKVLTHARR
ncbi:MAG: aminotransferase class I/II-fold pyridoxal phosphate-dependent enzyme [Candidatus Hydrogenedentes bacterium]|nr:aminotransferase class I/II-fold pyridoxal phosphate-dependent enzyme [Candidatus Hydrogenedentota bacterium]